jgi:CO/xanthine dehydrogenase FAD-binding subunit
MELAKLDLNLLLVFHHLLILKRVSAVAELLNMSQPAVSSALGRLRSSLNDELFIRTQAGMTPTPYALQLAAPVAMAMDATLTAASVRGRREISMAHFPAGYMTPSLEPDEMLVSVSLRPWASGHGHAFEEYARRHGDFAIVSAAVLISLDAQGVVDRASVTLGGVSAMPVRVKAAEQVLLGSRAQAADLAAAAAFCKAVEATSDSHVQGWYRQHLAQVLCGRALKRALERVER